MSLFSLPESKREEIIAERYQKRKELLERFRIHKQMKAKEAQESPGSPWFMQFFNHQKVNFN
jgi:hypothetical protein